VSVANGWEVTKKSSGWVAAGSRTTTRRTMRCGQTWYQSTSRDQSRRATVWPRSSTSASTQPVAAWASWGGEAFALGAGSAAFPGPWRRRFVQGCVAAHPGGDHGAGQVGADQGGVGAVGVQVEGPAGQPAGDLSDHLHGQRHRRRPALVVHPDVDRQAEGAAAPRWLDPQGEHDQVQTPCIDDLGPGRAHRVAKHPGPVDRSTGFLVDGVVGVQDHHAGRGQRLDHMHGEHLPQCGHAPRAGAHEPMVGIMGPDSVGVAGGEHPGDGAPARGEHPTGEQVGEDGEARPGEHRAGQHEQRRPALHRPRRAATRAARAARPALPWASSFACAAR